MSKNWAIVVGINSYYNLQSLQYAKRDAECIRDFLSNEAGFDRVFLFTEDSPEIPASPVSISTTPTYGNVRRFLRAQFERPLLEAGDNLWFFFAGHGQRSAERDYIMLLDTDPGDVTHTAISINYVTERLRKSGADNVILLLDACREESSRGTSGIGYEQHQGVVTIFSCSPKEKSYEVENLKQGSFTHSLLEGLRMQGESNCATVERLYYHLRYRVPEINNLYKKPRQTPYVLTEPATKLHLILLPRHATLRDVETLKKDALTEENMAIEALANQRIDHARQGLDFAEQLWIRVLSISPGDIDAVRGLQRVERFRAVLPQPPEVEMESEVGVDYTFLHDSLKNMKWRDADQMTAVIVLEIAKRREEGYLRPEDFQSFPCADLQTIDKLWRHFSQGRFGFSIQREIWQELGGHSKANDEVFQSFSKRVGWVTFQEEQKGESVLVKKQWKRWGELTFHASAPRGHLPSPPRWWELWDCFKQGEDAIFYRLDICR
jgi:uncharacterized caspase-like protein